eukprot:TRINITY_DN644_c0_g1_i1.p1 TRINITY_DN644_c0_g1~~TRINITY_DN644_c0_g1_i1.p1  ORF type:complete len:263 (+),score=73.41 TRINITY_DN644_c0_g1_i1:1333-2121(+)
MQTSSALPKKQKPIHISTAIPRKGRNQPSVTSPQMIQAIETLERKRKANIERKKKTKRRLTTREDSVDSDSDDLVMDMDVVKKHVESRRKPTPKDAPTPKSKAKDVATPKSKAKDAPTPKSKAKEVPTPNSKAKPTSRPSSAKRKKTIPKQKPRRSSESDIASPRPVVVSPSIAGRKHITFSDDESSSDEESSEPIAPTKKRVRKKPSPKKRPLKKKLGPKASSQKKKQASPKKKPKKTESYDNTDSSSDQPLSLPIKAAPS